MTIRIKLKIGLKKLLSLFPFSQGESVKYFLDNLEKLGQSVSPAHTAKAALIQTQQGPGNPAGRMYDGGDECDSTWQVY